MPTHQGKTQTDILIGDGGEGITIDSSIELTATYSANANFQYKDNVPSADNEDSSYELKLLDAAGGTLATFAAEYTCDPVTGTATNVSSTRTNTFNPSPNGSTPSFPSSHQTLAHREWEISSKKGNQTFAGFQASWKFASTVASGSVTQTVNTQNDGELNVTLVYSDAAGPVLEVDVVCLVAVSASSQAVKIGTPTVTDNIQP